ncbi:MAG TPA: 16S rRNA (cytosine(1402)-N(4))-methyltransferase RsmH [Gammaproteobacteria bacterium]|nr:16S rRNA (cytosine(1402)-N(4))-methyltransferase RsmH [Gammaproteobacteria bacterium]
MHVPVLLDEVLALLRPRADGVYVDCTFGRGGHTGAILARLGARGRVFAFDRDGDAALARPDLLADPRLCFTRQAYSAARATLEAAAVYGAIDGVLMDLGVSSPQLDTAARGFSFQHDGPLDMRMDTSAGETAAAWLARASAADIEQCLRDYGEERHARRIARRLAEARAQAPIDTTRRLAELVAAAVPRSGEKLHPATRTFQALRIRINDELGELARALPDLRDGLAPGGRLCVISFHSLEDRIVKRFFRDSAKPIDRYPAPSLPAPFTLVTRKPMVATAAECAANPRARSAHLRCLERAA